MSGKFECTPLVELLSRAGGGKVTGPTCPKCPHSVYRPVSIPVNKPNPFCGVCTPSEVGEKS
jgi:hypothetical protein